MAGTARNAIGFNSPDGLVRSTAAGAAAALAGAVIWATIVELTNYEVGVVAVLIGFLVGQAMAATAGTSQALPKIGAVLALIGCLLGQFFADAHYFGEAFGLTIGSALTKMVSHPSLGWSVFKTEFAAIDVLFWVIAAAQGYRLTARAVARRYAPAPAPIALQFPAPGAGPVAPTPQPAPEA